MLKNHTTQPKKVSRFRGFMDIPGMIKNPINIFSEYTDELGDTCIFYFGGVKKTMLTKNPAIIQHILKDNYENYHKSDIQMKRMSHFLGKGLLTSHGKAWLTQRRLIQQGFHKDQLAAVTGLMHEVLDESIELLEKEMKDGVVDIYKELMKMTFRNVTRSLFSVKLAENELALISDGITSIQAFMVKQIVLPYFDPVFRFTGILKKYDQMRFAADEIILSHIRHRRKMLNERVDMMQILMDARYSDGEGMNDTQLLAESMQLLVAGHETSSNALSWTMYLLSKNPKVLQKVRDEIYNAIGNEPLKFTDLQKLEYTNQVFDEAMRLYPPFWMVDREAVEDDEVNGIKIPKGTSIIAFIYGVHHSGEIWNEPSEFKPERFEREKKKQQKPFTHLPFGGGPRGCIGGNYAQLQMMVILTTLVRRYNFELVPNNVDIKPMLILRPENGIKMRFSKREIN